MPLLELRNVSSFYGNVQALKGVSLQVEQGEVVTLLGANGAGKSTTLRSISGLVPAASGEILFNGQPIHRLGPEAIVRMGISHVPEGRRIFPGLTVTENIMLGASNRGRIPKAQMQADVDEMFGIFPDLKRLSKALGWSLSGGQQQMLSVARGLMARPKLLMLDEPSLGLAPIIVQQLFGVLREIRKQGMTILLVLNASESRGLRREGQRHRTHHPQLGALKSRVVLTGYLSDAQVTACMRGAQAFVMSSHYEGFGLPILEAAGKTRIVLSDTPIFREVASYMRNASLVDFRNPADAAAAIGRTLDRPMTLTELAPDWQQELRWETAAEQHAQVFRQVLEGCTP